MYLCLSGRADLTFPDAPAGAPPVTVIEPGRLIGDLAVILDQPRTMNLRATEDCRFLRIGAAEYRAVIESDINVALRLLETVAGNLATARDKMVSIAHQTGGTISEDRPRKDANPDAG